MRPFIFHIGNTGIPSFFFMIMVATLAATFVMIRFGKREGLSEIVVLDMAIIAVVASIIGARLFHVFVEAPGYYWEKPIRIFYFWQGGFVSLGAFVASVLGWIIYLKYRKLPVARYFDLAALVTPVIKFFVRMGCLFTGCCYGSPTELPIYLRFTNPGSTAFQFYPNIPVHATQLYSMLNAAVMFVVLYIVYKRRKFYGQVLAVFLMYYGVSRFIIEFFRGDVDRGVYFGIISTGQVMMLVSFIAGVIVYKICRKRNFTPPL